MDTIPIHSSLIAGFEAHITTMYNKRRPLLLQSRLVGVTSLLASSLLHIHFASSPFVAAFSAQPAPSAASNSPKPFIELVTLDSPMVDKIPTSFTESWSTWVLDESGAFSKIPDSDGFVPPASVDQLFQPLDLKPPQFRLALGIHVRDGNIRHIMPALDVCFEGGQHRNRGLCSVPRAYRWIGYDNKMLLGDLEGLQVRAFQRKQGEDDDGEGADWTELDPFLSGDKVASAVRKVIFALAESAPGDLGKGSNVIHALVDSSDTGLLEYPGNAHELCLVMDDRDLDVSPDDEDAKGKLQVTISAAMAGSESQYLPDAYKPLYQDASLRNPRYERYRERREQQ